MGMQHHPRTLCIASAACFALIAADATRAQNAPQTPTITEPAAPDLVLNPSDVHMETAPFFDQDGDSHRASTWEIWMLQPSQRVWVADNVTGFEKVHAHFGDGVFENSHAGLTRLFPDTQFTMRVRHRDDSNDPASEWSDWASIPFSTASLGVKDPMFLQDIDNAAPPVWRDSLGNDIELPTGAPQPMLRVETDTRWLLLRIDGSAAIGNATTNPPPLPVHRAVRVVVKAGDTGQPLVLPESELQGFEVACEPFTIYLPAMTLQPGDTRVFWVGEHGSTYVANPNAFVPEFSTLARTQPVPWQPVRAGYEIDVVATGLRMPVNVAFVPNPSSAPGAPKFYVTELYGNIKVVTNSGVVGTYASGVINYTPSGAFPGSGEQGLTGIVVEPQTGDLLVGHLWRTGGQNFPRVTRYSSNNGGLTASSSQVVLDMQGEPQGQSHLISCLELVGQHLYVHMGDGFDASTALDMQSFRGKILRLNLDGSPVTTNPFYNGAPFTSRDYVYCLGIRNAFGGSRREADGFRYAVENGPSTDRLTKLVAGRNFGWNGQNGTMTQFALHNWVPSSGPVNIAFVQPGTFGGSGFPVEVMDHAFVTESGATYAEGEQAIGKRITEFTFDAAGNVTSGPTPFVEYVGDGFATAVGLTAGPDGLYFTEFYSDVGTVGPTTVGGRVLRVRFENGVDCDGNGLVDACEIAAGAPDLDLNGVLDVCDPLQASAVEASVSTLGQIDFTLRAGAENAGHAYHLLGSMTGTQPGTQFGNVLLPLNSQNDPWFALTFQVFSPVILQNTFGTLDAEGEASASLIVPPLGSLLGLQFFHAYLVTDAVNLQARFASNPVPLRMVQ